MGLKEEFAGARAEFALLTLYQKFEQVVVLFLTGLIALVIVFAVWNLTVKIVGSVLLSSFDPTDYSVF